MQRAIACLFMRGGTSRGPFFHRADLPADTATRDRVLLAVMGSPHPRQIDGLGGGHPLTSKAGMVSRSSASGVDLDFVFAQLQPETDTVDTTPNCGNMLAAVVPFALETGLVEARGETSTFRVRTLNTDMTCDITVQTPDGRVTYEGAMGIDGVPGTAAPIAIAFLDTAGSVCSALLPTGQTEDEVDVQGVGKVRVTCIDNGMPMVLVRALDLGRTGRESVSALNADTELKTKLEALRLHCGERMGLGDVRSKTYPKMCLIAPPERGGSIATRCFIPHVCHDAIGVLAAVTVGSACILEGTVAQGMAVVPAGAVKTLSVEHPTGEFSVELERSAGDPKRIVRAALVRTARLIMRGEVMVPHDVWPDNRKNDR
jgi:4-oxalomesaconate tautomerase